MRTANSPLALTKLVEPAGVVAQTVSLPGFDAAMAQVLGNCCSLTYRQLAAGLPPTLALADIQNLSPGNSLVQTAGITVSEAVAPGAGAGDGPGMYVTLPVGFALAGAAWAGGPEVNIIALRGTRSFSEWIDDIEGVPAPFRVGDNGGNYYSRADYGKPGLVHAGFNALYTTGTDGAAPVETKKELLWAEYSRPQGSIAAQIAVLVEGSGWNKALPVYVTGHSLGGALATLCTMDLGTNFSGLFPSGKLAMYTLAAPMVAVGISVFTIGVDAGDFARSFQAVAPNSVRIVNAADLVPMVPMPKLNLGPLALSYEHATPNQVTFCAQTGSIGGNHSCTDTYVPYLHALASGFQG